MTLEWRRNQQQLSRQWRSGIRLLLGPGNHHHHHYHYHHQQSSLWSFIHHQPSYQDNVMKGGTKDQLKPIILHQTDDLIHTHPILNIHKQICSFIIQLFCFLREVRERLILSLLWEASILFFPFFSFICAVHRLILNWGKDYSSND